MINEYLIFGGECFYAAGGGFDLLGAKQTLPEAIGFCQKVLGKKTLTKSSLNIEYGAVIEWVHVFSVLKGEIIYEEGDKPYGSWDGPVVKIEGIEDDIQK